MFICFFFIWYKYPLIICMPMLCLNNCLSNTFVSSLHLLDSLGCNIRPPRIPTPTHSSWHFSPARCHMLPSSSQVRRLRGSWQNLFSSNFSVDLASWFFLLLSRCLEFKFLNKLLGHPVEIQCYLIVYTNTLVEANVCPPLYNCDV